MSQSQPPETEQPYYMLQHDEAVARGQQYYTDARTGYLVFTALGLKARGYCCQSGCRHCPFGFTKPGQDG